MQRQMKVFWGILLLLSVIWIAAGIFFTSDAFNSGQLGDEVTSGVKSLASSVDVVLPAAYSPALVFLVTGLPVAVLSLFFYSRNRRAIGAAMSSASDGNIRRQTIAVTLLALVVALFIWNMRDVENAVRGTDSAATGISLSVVTYPIRLFVTYVHEAGHSLAALLTGGQVHGFEVSPDGSGVARTSGGNISLILPAGYLGAALFGSLLFFLTNRVPRWTRGLAFLLGLAIIALTLGYALPSAERGPTALIVGVGFGVGLIALGWQAPRLVNVFVLNTLAILTSLNAVFDLRLLVQNADAQSAVGVNDAAQFSEKVTPLLPASVVAAIWAAVAFCMLGAAVYFGLVKQVGGELSSAVREKNDAASEA